MHEESMPRVGDEVVTADELRAGDVVYFERTDDTHVVIRAMTSDRLAGYDGPLFVIEPTAEGSARFRAVGRDEVEG